MLGWHHHWAANHFYHCKKFPSFRDLCFVIYKRERVGPEDFYDLLFFFFGAQFKNQHSHMLITKHFFLVPGLPPRFLLSGSFCSPVLAAHLGTLPFIFAFTVTSSFENNLRARCGTRTHYPQNRESCALPPKLTKCPYIYFLNFFFSFAYRLLTSSDEK